MSSQVVSRSSSRAKRPDNGTPLGGAACPNVGAHLGTQPIRFKAALVGWRGRVLNEDTRVQGTLTG